MKLKDETTRLAKVRRVRAAILEKPDVLALTGQVYFPKLGMAPVILRREDVLTALDNQEATLLESLAEKV